MSKLQTYKCVACGHKVKTKELSSIRCPKCEYKGLELEESKK
jgi:DNA-directed RNA polymerase subunit RPC12/RpoP